MSEPLLVLQADRSMTAAPIASVRASATSRGTLSLRANFSWTFAGNVVYAGCQWAMLMVLAKLGNAAMVGEYALGLAITAPVILLSNLQLRGVLATDANDEYQFREYLTLRILTTIVALLSVVGIVSVMAYRRETAMVILAVALSKSLESISDIAYGFLQRQEQMDRIAQSMMLRGGIAILALWGGVYVTRSVFVGTMGVAAGWGAVLLLFDLTGVRLRDGGERSTHATGYQLHLEWRRLSRLAIVAAPLGIVMMLLSLSVNIPRYVIERQLGEGALGVFAAVAYLMVAGSTVVGALGQSASPRLAQYHADGDTTKFSALMRKLIGMGAALGAIGIVVAVTAGGPLLRILFRSDYAASADVLTWMMIAAAISYVGSFLGYGLTAARRFTVQAPFTAIVTCSTAAAALLLVPRHGLIGAAWSTIIGALVQLMGGAILLCQTTTLANRTRKL